MVACGPTAAGDSSKTERRRRRHEAGADGLQMASTETYSTAAVSLELVGMEPEPAEGGVQPETVSEPTVEATVEAATVEGAMAAEAAMAVAAMVAVVTAEAQRWSGSCRRTAC